jgi:predicted amino acid dehydrogenase
MTRIAVLHFHHAFEPYEESVQLLGHTLTLRHVGCESDVGAMHAHILQCRDKGVAAIALEGVAKELRLGSESVLHVEAERLFGGNHPTPVVDGQGILAAMERWAVRLADEQQPGIWSHKRVLMVPGLNHGGLVDALRRHTEEIRYADPIVYFALPSVPGVGSAETLEPAAKRTLPQLREYPFYQLFAEAGHPYRDRSPKLFDWADVLAGDIAAIRRYTPERLEKKIVVTAAVSPEDVADLQARGASILITTLPPLTSASEFAQHGAATFEACLAALRPDPSAPLNEDTYLNLLAELQWQPGLRYLQPEEAAVNRFSFVLYPLTDTHLRRALGWARYLPQRATVHLLPFHVGRITGVESQSTGQKVEGDLFMLGGTPEQLNQREPGFIYRRLMRAAEMSERLGARIMGVGDFASAVGEAGQRVANKADIAINTGQSLTLAATLEAAKQAVIQMDNQIDQFGAARVLLLGATAPSGEAWAHLVAAEGANLTIVANTPEKLIMLKQELEQSYPTATVRISTTPAELLPQADVIILIQTNQPLDVTQCKPGAIICDMTRPHVIDKAAIERRPDILVISAGEVKIPGQPNLGIDLGLPEGVAYACLAETILLAMEGRFQDFTAGTEVEQVREILRLFHKHQFQLSGIRTHDAFVTEEEIAAKRKLAEEFRAHPERLQAWLAGEGERTAEATAVTHIRVGERQLPKRTAWMAGAGLLTVLLAVVGWFFSRKKGEAPPSL